MIYTTNTFFSIAGLLLDIVGAILIFKYGIPNDLSPDGFTFKDVFQTKDTNQIIENKKAEYIEFKKKSDTGLSCLIAGFILQFIAVIKLPSIIVSIVISMR